MTAEALKLFPEVLEAVSATTALTITFGAAVYCGCMTPDGLVVGVESGAVALISDKGLCVEEMGRHAKGVWCLAAIQSTSASGSVDGSVRLWDTHTRKEISRLQGHSSWIRSLLFHPDGSQLYSASDDLTIKVWSCSTSSELLTLQGHTQPISSLVITKDSQTLISSDTNGSIRVWSTSTWLQTAHLLSHDRDIPCLTLTPDSKFLISASEDTTVTLWKLPNCTKITTFTTHKEGVWCVAVAQDSSFFLSASTDHTIRQWSLQTFTEIGVLVGHTKEVNSLAITSSQQFAVSGAGDCTVKVWCLPKLLEVVTLTGHSDWVYRVIISLDSTRIYSCGKDGCVKVWSLDDMRETDEILRHEGNITCLSTSITGKFTVSAAGDTVIKVWDWEKMSVRGSMKGHRNWITCLEVTRDGKWVVTGADDCTVRVWSVGEMREKEVFEGHTLGITCLGTTSDSLLAVSASSDKTLRVYNLTSLAVSGPCIGHEDPILCLALLPNTHKALSGACDSSIRLWDLDNACLLSAFFGHTSAIRCLAVASDCRTFISIDTHVTAKVWDVTEGQPVAELKGHLADITALFYTPNGKYIVTGSSDYSIRVWDPVTYRPISTLTGHLKEIKAVTSTPDSELLLSSASDDMLLVWSLRSMKEVARYRVAGVVAITVSPDSHYCVVALANHTILSYNLSFKITHLRPILPFPFPTNLSHSGCNSFFGASISLLKQGKMINALTASALVQPYSFNGLHVCAYYNHANALEYFLKNGVPVARGAFGSFLTVGLHRNTRKCIDVGLQHLTQICNEDKGWAAVQEVAEDIPGLLATHSPLVTFFIEAIFRPSTQSDLNHFIFPAKPLPIIVMNPNWYVSMEEYESETAGLQHEEVEVLVSDLCWNWSLGSRPSLSLLTSLESCIDRKILTTPLITTILTWKWTRLMPITLTLTVIYSSLLISMICLVFNYGPISFIQNLFLSLNGFLLIYEGVQSLVNGYEYWQDPWNYLDWVRSSLCLLWIFYFKGHQYVELCVICMCFLRGFTYFRTFKMTRMYVRLTLEVIKEMYSFLVVFAYAIIAFGMMYAVLVPVQVTSAFRAWMTAYELLMGTYSTDGYESLQWLCFTCASLVNVIIMLNLLISILGDAYEHSHTYAKENDTLEMLRIIIEYESMLFWRRNTGVPMIPTLCRVPEGQGSNDEWEGKIKQITKRIKDELTLNERYMTERSGLMEGRIEGLKGEIGTVDEALKRVKARVLTSDQTMLALKSLLEESHSSLENRLIYAEAGISRLHSKLDSLLKSVVSNSH